MTKNKGFTLLELIVVIVVLAILAVTAMPRFLNIQDDAHESAVKGAGAALEAGVNFVQMQWQVETKGSGAVIDLQGYGKGEIDTNELGFPIGTDKHDNPTLPYNIGVGHVACAKIWNSVLSDGHSAGELIEPYADDDYLGIRTEKEITLKDGSKVVAKSVCKYIYTRNGFDPDPNKARYVLSYDSRTGKVTMN